MRCRVLLITVGITLTAGCLLAAVPPDAMATGAQDQTWSHRVAALIEKLASNQHADREQAQNDLVEIGSSAIPQLSEALAHQDPEVASRARTAIETIKARLEKRRLDLRQAIEQAARDNDAAAESRHYRALLKLPDPELRDARAAMRALAPREDWAALADAYEAAADAIWRIIHLPAEAFIRPAAAQAHGLGPMDPRIEGDPHSIQVQTDLDGIWVHVRGEFEHWLPRLQRQQQQLREERIRILQSLGKLYLGKLGSPRQAVAAYEAAGEEVPLQSEPLKKLIPSIWPTMQAKPAEVLALDQAGATAIRTEVLHGLAEAQIAAGDVRGAAHTRLRAMLAMLIEDQGDGNAHGPMTEAEAFWEIARRLPAGEPLPPTLWLQVLDRDHPERNFPDPEAGPHGLPRSFPGPRLVVRPGHRARALTVSALMETPGGGGGVRCFTLIDGKVHTLGRVQWHADRRPGREWRSATFAVPDQAGIIRLEITPFKGSDFHVRELKVRAAFAPPGAEPP